MVRMPNMVSWTSTSLPFSTTTTRAQYKFGESLLHKTGFLTRSVESNVVEPDDGIAFAGVSSIVTGFREPSKINVRVNTLAEVCLSFTTVMLIPTSADCDETFDVVM